MPLRYLHIAKPLTTRYNAQLQKLEVIVSPYKGKTFRRAEPKKVSKRAAIRLGWRPKDFSKIPTPETL